jgi:polysaccharide pyruvyl transferase CsaB
VTTSVNRPIRIAALGYYGFGNLGDEAVLAGIRRALQKEGVAGEMLVLSNDPPGTERLHPGVRAVNRWKWREVATALAGTDLFILGGGSLLQDATSARSVLWYGLMTILARRRSRRMLWWGQGIGPLNVPNSRRMVRLIANQADALTVRDEDSAALLKAVGARGSIQVVADPAFALEPSPQDPSSELLSGSSSRALLALRSWKDDSLGRAVGADLSKLLVGFATEVEAIPMHLPDDAEYLQSRAPSLLTYDWKGQEAGPEIVLGRVAAARFVIAMRLHALIFAARCGTPFVALSYDPKVDALAKAAGQTDALIPVDTVTAAGLEAVLQKVRDTEATRRETLKAFAEVQQEKALLPARAARAML